MNNPLKIDIRKINDSINQYLRIKSINENLSPKDIWETIKDEKKKNDSKNQI
jgi:hypothetical protein